MTLKVIEPLKGSLEGQMKQEEGVIKVLQVEKKNQIDTENSFTERYQTNIKLHKTYTDSH